jgi:hypothetical protein
MENVPSAGIADVLMEKAHKLGADLRVAGAFGHARLQESLAVSLATYLLT